MHKCKCLPTFVCCIHLKSHDSRKFAKDQDSGHWNGFHRVGQLVIELSHEFLYRSYFHKDGRKPVGEIVCKQSSFKVSADLLSITNLPTWLSSMLSNVTHPGLVVMTYTTMKTIQQTLYALSDLLIYWSDDYNIFWFAYVYLTVYFFVIIYFYLSIHVRYSTIAGYKYLCFLISMSITVCSLFHCTCQSQSIYLSFILFVSLFISFYHSQFICQFV